MYPCSTRPLLLSSKTPFFLLSFLHSQQNYFHCRFFNHPALDAVTQMSTTKLLSSAHQSSVPIEEEKDELIHRITPGNEAISLQEWQNWGTISPVPHMVKQVIQDLNMLEKDIRVPMTFNGNHGMLTGEFKVHEDKKHRATYAALGTSEEKIQFFSARQIACRLLGSRGYLCQKCWLPLGDCMCSRITMCSLWDRVRIWLYMHPKDFLRQNNTGKLLWQVFGVHAATLCLFGITEHEEMMWNEFSSAGRNKVWCLYPNKNAPTESIEDGVSQYLCRNLQTQAV